MFTQTSAAGGEWMITRGGGLGGVTTGTYNGVASGFQAYVNNTESGSQNDFFINNLSISGVPEPTSLVLFGIAGSVCLIRRRKKS